MKKNKVLFFHIYKNYAETIDVKANAHTYESQYYLLWIINAWQVIEKWADAEQMPNIFRECWSRNEYECVVFFRGWMYYELIFG